MKLSPNEAGYLMACMEVDEASQADRFKVHWSSLFARLEHVRDRDRTVYIPPFTNDEWTQVDGFYNLVTPSDPKYWLSDYAEFCDSVRKPDA